MSRETAEISIPVSPGELLDRLAIAMVRCAQILEGPERQAAIIRRQTLESIQKSSLDDHPRTTSLFQILLGLNQRLWELEDRIRELRDSAEHRSEFVHLAYEIFSVNDRRSELKRQIDQEYGATGETKVFRTSKLTEDGSHG
jgi:hypothetical protein